MIPYFKIEALELFGPVAIQPWGVLVALGFILGTMVCRRYAEPRGMDPDTYSDIVVWLALGGLVFGHLGHAFFYQWDYYRDHPLELLKFWDGLSSYGGYIGCMTDGADKIWVGGSQLHVYDGNSMAHLGSFPVGGDVKGVSIDFDGNVWGVSQGSDAYRLDPATGQFDTFTGLVDAYSYSDMTGFGLTRAGYVPVDPQ